jgi:hypothetical protein
VGVVAPRSIHDFVGAKQPKAKTVRGANGGHLKRFFFPCPSVQFRVW